VGSRARRGSLTNAESVEDGVGCGGGRSQSWAPFICLGRRGKASEEAADWR
jgi:hypothetical protein